MKINRRDIFSNSFKLGSFLQEKKKKDYLENLPDFFPIRPPGALLEKEFLETCTRCEACVEACPHFAIENDYGYHFDDGKHYPSLNVDYIPCQMCEDFPCIQVCEPKALIMPIKDAKVKIGEAQILVNGCLTWNDQACDLCHSQCPEQAIIFDEKKHTRIISSRCTGCGLCVEPCPEGTYAIKVISKAELSDKKKNDSE